jgi:hypothetical protein
MRFTDLLALAALAAGSMILIACSGDPPGVASSSTGSGGGGGGSGGGGSSCAPAPAFSYANCEKSGFFPDGTCLAGECATIPLEARVFKEWRTQIKALSGLDDAALDDRIKVSTVLHNGGPEEVGVDIGYLISIDWIRAPSGDRIIVGSSPLVTPPTDAAIKDAVTLSINAARWQTLGALTDVAPRAATQAAFDSCACGMEIDYCSIQFDPMGGNVLVLGGGTPFIPTMNHCVSALVAVGHATLYQCVHHDPCAVN